MIITKIEKYKGSTYLVELDEDNSYFLHSTIIADNYLRVGKEIDEDGFEEILHQSQLRKAYERALYLLDIRDYSYTEMFEKLNSNYDDDICYQTLEKLVRLNMIDDRRYAENLARKLVEVKKYGYHKAVFEMKRKGIDRELCEEMLSAYSDTQDERLLELISRKYSRYLDNCDDTKAITKVKNALVRQGYSFDSVNRCIEAYFEEN